MRTYAAQEGAMLIIESRFRRATEDASPERWRLHIIGPMFAL
jgi:hypothetical protein